MCACIKIIPETCSRYWIINPLFSLTVTIASGGWALDIGSKLGESKKIVECGICDPKYTARRDYMNRENFPKKHPDQLALY